MTPLPREIAVSDQNTLNVLIERMPKAEPDPLHPLGSMFTVPIIIDTRLALGRVEIRNREGGVTGAVRLIDGRWRDALIDHRWTLGLMLACVWLDQIRERTNLEPSDEQTKRITDECFRNRPCRDCGVPIGQPHSDGCDVPICLWTGIQRLQCDGLDDPCDCEDANGYSVEGYTIHTCGQQLHDCGRQIWNGVWPGYSECIEYGWFTWFQPPWHECGPEHPQAVPDLTRLHRSCDWDRIRGRWVRRGKD